MECQKKLDEALGRTRRGAPAVDARFPLGEWCEYWLEKVVPLKGLAESTAASYASVLKSTILRHPISNLALSDITAVVIRDWQVDLLGSHRNLSPATVRRAHALLRACLDVAVADDLRASNPVALVPAPRNRHREIEVPTVGQVERILLALHGSIVHELIKFIANTGVRRGEAVALKWADVDFARGCVYIRRTESTRARGVLLKEPKTRASRRQLDMDPIALRELLLHRDRQLALGYACGPNDPLFPDEHEQHLKGRRVLTVFKRACADAGEPGFKVHSLRHFAATTMLTNGVTPHLVALVLGHSSPSITLNYYAHAVGGGGAGALEALGRAMRPTLAKDRALALNELPSLEQGVGGHPMRATKANLTIKAMAAP